jgi:hypothetical protein
MENQDPDQPNVILAYNIIESLLDSHEALIDLLVLMSDAIDQDVLKAITNTTEWEKYLATNRSMERTKEQIKTLTDALVELVESEKE